MQIEFILIMLGVALLLVVVFYLFLSGKFNNKISEYRTISESINSLSQDLRKLKSQLTQAKEKLSKTDNETKELQKLKKDADQIKSDLATSLTQLDKTSVYIEEKKNELTALDTSLHQMKSKIDLYSRLDEFVEYGLFEEPEYLFETSDRFSEEIKKIRRDQKELVMDKEAITCPDTELISSYSSQNRKILNGQIKLMLSAFNIECDFLIGKVNPSNFSRTLERIEKLAATLEKSAATLHCGFNIKYVKLKFEECKLQYQFVLKKKEEQEEQRLIRAQIREEQKAIKEHQKAIDKAQKEERMYLELLEKARQELKRATEEERAAAEKRIANLEQQLAEAEATEQRAKSLAEQTKRGHVYIISNIGSLGKGIYKIGLTRRLDPMERVKELGDASVPFVFDVHAIIYSDDAPKLEISLHRKFSDKRVNAVNMRKEFFEVDLIEIKKEVENLTDGENSFKMTVLAEEYYESQRLRGIVSQH